MAVGKPAARLTDMHLPGQQWPRLRSRLPDRAGWRPARRPCVGHGGVRRPAGYCGDGLVHVLIGGMPAAPYERGGHWRGGRCGGLADRRGCRRGDRFDRHGGCREGRSIAINACMTKAASRSAFFDQPAMRLEKRSRTPATYSQASAVQI